MELSENARKIFEMKYARTLANGNKESWPQAIGRVANHVAGAEDSESDRLQYTAEFTKIMLERTFLPGGRIIANSGTGVLNLMNCFVLPVEDSRKSIYDALSKSAEIFAWGGGIGYNFSSLRAKGSPVHTTGGKASGPLSFMELFDLTGEVISQASRRGAQMGILNVDHPDIRDFIRYKNTLNTRNDRIFSEFSDSLRVFDDDDALDALFKVLSDNQLTHFNVSVGITDEFMKSFVHGSAEAEDLLHLIAENAWNNGDPGIFFTDRANKDNMVPYLGKIDATNPCGEVPLLPYEPCCLGSINLERFVEGTYIDFAYLEEVVGLAIRFLDNVHSVNFTPIDEINKAARKTRRLGLGVMGFADMLAELGIPYDHSDARILASILAKSIQKYAWKTSQDLADERGPFPAFDENKVNWRLLENAELDKKPVRNVACTSIAPTGSIALIADVNSGIEPFFAKKYIRNITHGVGNVATDSVEQSVKGKNIKVAHEIHWEDHISMQAQWQKHVDNAVSKTINMPNDATVDDVMSAYITAWEAGLKGVTIYRDGSKMFQILNADE